MQHKPELIDRGIPDQGCLAGNEMLDPCGSFYETTCPYHT